MRELNRLGVTSLIDAGGGGQNYPEHYQAIARLAADKALTVRIGYTLMAQRPGREIEDYKGWLSQAKLYQGDDYFRLCGAGEYTVWAAGDVTNFAKDPLPQPPIMEEKLTEVLKFVASNGWPFRMHASFDFTAQRILGVVEKVHTEVPVNKLRWGLEHCEGMTTRTLDRLASAGRQPGAAKSHVVGRRGLCREMGKRGGGGCAGARSHQADGSAVRARHGRQPRFQS